MTVKIVQVLNFARSAMAPETRATAMMAKTAWKATKAVAGMPPAAAVPAAAAEGVGGVAPARCRACRGVSRDVAVDLVHEAAQAEVREGVAHQAAANVGAEGLAVAPEDPHRADRAHRDERHHHHVEDALGANHAAVEEGETGGHEQDQGGSCQDPRGVPTVGERRVCRHEGNCAHGENLGRAEFRATASFVTAVSTTGGGC